MDKTVLSIAGSDSSAGAGIQADIKTVSALGCYAATVITAITAQNSQAVSAIEAVSAKTVKQQLDAVFTDLDVAAVKIGMLYRQDIIQQVVDALNHYRPQWVVLDPVMVAKSGDRLIAKNTIDYLQTHLFPLASLITPNIDEAQQLQQCTIEDSNMAREVARAMSEKYQTNVLIKGGHLPDTKYCQDILWCYVQQRAVDYRSQRINTKNTHGTGCTLSSAIATCLAQGNSLDMAVRKAKAYLQSVLQSKRTKSLGRGIGPIDHFFTTRREQP